MMCPSFLLLCPCLTSLPLLHIDIRNTTRNPELSSPLLSSLLCFLFCPSFFYLLPLLLLCAPLMNPTHGGYTPFDPNPLEDPKLRLKHHSLMQDYRELHMDTEAMRRRLQTMRKRKATLMAEVRFLRRRYRHLRQDQAVMQQPDKNKVRGRRSKSKKQIGVEVSSTSKRSEGEISSNHVLLPDLNHTAGKVHDDEKTETTGVKRRVPLFDLNQISGEEEEETEAMKNDDLETMCKRTSSVELQQQQQQQQQKEMKLSSCRDGGNSSSNKRKISWQDPLAALRV